MFKLIYKFILQSTVAAACLLPTITSADSETVSEYTRKADFIYKFSKFIQWPDKTDKLNLCIYGKDPFGPALDKLNNKLSNKRIIKVVRTRSINQVKKCHIAFINNIPETPRYYKRVMRRISRGGVLTISNADKAHDYEVMIGLINNKNITFKANDSRINKSKLRISSKLLRLSKEKMDYGN